MRITHIATVLRFVLAKTPRPLWGHKDPPPPGDPAVAETPKYLAMHNSILATLTRITDGDPSAVAWLYDAFAPRLLRRLTGRFAGIPGSDPEDLLHDTFLYLLKRRGLALDRFRSRHRHREPRTHDLDHFLWCAACGIASNRRRSLRRHPSASIEGHTLPDEGGEKATLARDALERIAARLAQSGDRLALYFQLRYRDGHKPAEIAHLTGWSLPATYKLKQALDVALDRCVEELGLGSL